MKVHPANPTWEKRYNRKCNGNTTIFILMTDNLPESSDPLTINKKRNKLPVPRQPPTNPTIFSTKSTIYKQTTVYIHHQPDEIHPTRTRRKRKTLTSKSKNYVLFISSTHALHAAHTQIGKPSGNWLYRSQISTADYNSPNEQTTDTQDMVNFNNLSKPIQQSSMSNRYTHKHISNSPPESTKNCKKLQKILKYWYCTEQLNTCHIKTINT
jgi:hypothetical protein